MKRCHSCKPELLRSEYPTGAKARISKLPNTSEQDKSSSKPKEKPSTYSNHHLLKASTTNRQRNVSQDISDPLTAVRYSPITESIKLNTSPKRRSKSTVSDRQPWGQLLNKHMNAESESVFGNFDPLRTLHFLARELQMHIQAKMPEEHNMQEIIKAMHAALKRIPPEVASTVQLQQQSLGLLPQLRRSASSFEVTSSERLSEEHLSQQLHSKELGEIQKLIEGSSKLEASCKHLENVYSQLRDEKASLESLVQNERTKSKLLEMKVEEMDLENKRLVSALAKRDLELKELKSTIESLEEKLVTKNIVPDLEESKSKLEQENQKLSHQLRLCAIEKEKFLAILAVRDRQIFEIRNEMTQLQKSVDEQLVELHNCAVASLPDQTEPISSLWTNEDALQVNSDHSLNDFYSDDNNQK